MPSIYLTSSVSLKSFAASSAYAEANSPVGIWKKKRLLISVPLFSERLFTVSFTQSICLSFIVSYLQLIEDAIELSI